MSNREPENKRWTAKRKTKIMVLQHLELPLGFEL